MSEPIRHILIAYDGSSQARIALDRAIDMARTWSSRLSIVTAYQAPIQWWTAGPMIPPELPGEAERAALGKALREAVGTAEARGISNVRGEFFEEHPADAILRYAEAEQVDLIVMGSRGQSTTARLLLGSVSDAVIHHARVAVLVVRPPAVR